MIFLCVCVQGTRTQLKCQVTSHLFTVCFSPTKLSSSCPFCGTGTCLQGICSVIGNPVEGKQGLGSREEFMVFKGSTAPAFHEPQQCLG